MSKLGNTVGTNRTLGCWSLLAGMTLALGCAGGGDGSQDCVVLNARISGLNQSIASVNAVATSLRADVLTACAAIAGETAPAAPTDADVTRLCNAARARLDAQLSANVEIQVVVIPPVCQVNAQAQLNCEASCYAEAQVTCDPGSVEVRCDPGDLSVVCEGSCNVNATCEGSVEVAVQCAAECDGKCNGTCNGDCSAEVMNTNGQAECAGNCQGTCTGTCNGSCKVTAQGGVMCGAEARCKGGCSVQGREPQCEAALEPPACEGNAQVDCNAACDAKGTLEVQCDRDDVEVQVTVVGDAQADFVATLEAQLPTLVLAARRGALALESVGQLGADVAAAGSAAGSCGLGLAAQFALSATAAVQASASVSVSFQASANVSAGVAGGAG
jgi:hypothetical protein